MTLFCYFSIFSNKIRSDIPPKYLKIKLDRVYSFQAITQGAAYHIMILNMNAPANTLGHMQEY